MQCPMSNHDTEAKADGNGFIRCRCGRFVRLVKPRPGELAPGAKAKVLPRVAAHNVPGSKV